MKSGTIKMVLLSSSSSSSSSSSLGILSSSIGIRFSNPIRFRTLTLTPYSSIPPTLRRRINLLPSHHIMASTNGKGAATVTATAPKWTQKTITIPAQKRGCHLITKKILKEIEQDLSEFRCGLAHLFLQHTSASLTINENYDSDVRDDTETFLNRVVPEGGSAPWKHTLEGSDDMPAHIKSSLFGCALMVPITNGTLNLGTWQGIWLCEHRDYATPRQIVVTLNGI